MIRPPTPDDAKRDAVERLCDASLALSEATVRKNEADREEAAARMRFQVALRRYGETVEAAKASIQEPTFFTYAFGPATAVREWSEPIATFPSFASCVQRVAKMCLDGRQPATVYGFVGQPSKRDSGQDVTVEIDAAGGCVYPVFQRHRVSPETGRRIVGSEPDCIADGDSVTLWDCECAECRGLQATHPSPETDA